MKRELTTYHLEFIIEKCPKYLEFSSALVKQLIEDKDDELLNIIFFHFNFFDNEFIIEFTFIL